jgi:hypothetical protein
MHGEQTLTMPLCPNPPYGVDPLQSLGTATYGAHLPESRIAESYGPHIELRDNGADLVLPVPEQPPSAFHVSRQGVELLHVKAARWRRTSVLPPSLRPWHGRRAWHDGAALRVRFEA